MDFLSYGLGTVSKWGNSVPVILDENSHNFTLDLSQYYFC